MQWTGAPNTGQHGLHNDPAAQRSVSRSLRARIFKHTSAAMERASCSTRTPPPLPLCLASTRSEVWPSKPSPTIGVRRRRSAAARGGEGRGGEGGGLHRLLGGGALESSTTTAAGCDVKQRLSSSSRACNRPTLAARTQLRPTAPWQDMRKQRGAARSWNTRQMASMREVLPWMQTVLVLASDNVSRFAQSRRNWRFRQLHVNPVVAIGFAKCDISFSLKNLDGDRQQHVFPSHKSEL